MANSFEPLFASGDTSAPNEHMPEWMSAIAERGGFSPDVVGSAETSPPELDEEDSLYTAGLRAGREAALLELAEQGQVREQLRLSLEKLDRAFSDRLADRLGEAVIALCEATMAPMAIDPDALQQRCIAAAGAVGDGIVDASLHLHPDDIALLDAEFASTWHLVPDPDQERGTVVFEMPEGAVRDGPSEWRAALRDALGLIPADPKAGGSC